MTCICRTGRAKYIGLGTEAGARRYVHEVCRQVCGMQVYMRYADRYEVHTQVCMRYAGMYMRYADMYEVCRYVCGMQVCMRYAGMQYEGDSTRRRRRHEEGRHEGRLHRGGQRRGQGRARGRVRVRSRVRFRVRTTTPPEPRESHDNRDCAHTTTH